MGGIFDLMVVLEGKEFCVIHPAMWPTWQELDEFQKRALLLVLFAQAGHGYDLGNPRNKRVAISWWSEFLPGRVRVAAKTCSDLSEFSSRLAGLLRGQIGAKGTMGEIHRRIWSDILACSEDIQQAVLDVLDRQASALVTMVRADIDLRKKEKKDGQENSEERFGVDASSEDSICTR